MRQKKRASSTHRPAGGRRRQRLARLDVFDLGRNANVDHFDLHNTQKRGHEKSVLSQCIARARAETDLKLERRIGRDRTCFGARLSLVSIDNTNVVRRRAPSGFAPYAQAGGIVMRRRSLRTETKETNETAIA